MRAAAEDAAGRESLLVQSLLEIRSGRLDGAAESIDRLVERQPNFRLAHLIRGDLWLARAGRLERFGGVDGSDRLDGLRHEAQARLRHYLGGHPSQAIPGSVLDLPRSVGRALVVDLSEYRLYVVGRRQGEGPTHDEDYYISIGKGGAWKEVEGDERTPVGVYFVADYLPGSDLPELYGEGAFPISYPNAWDRRRGRTGSGIWIHGTESENYSRAPQSSRGCVTLSNSDFLDLKAAVQVRRTPVIVTERESWVTTTEQEATRALLVSAVQTWRRDWESLDTENYLGHYSADFRSGSMDWRDWARHKRRVNSGKRFIRVELDEIGIYRYPGEDGMFLVEFSQNYRSDNFSAKTRKHQYWRREADGAWRIIQENKT